MCLALKPAHYWTIPASLAVAKVSLSSRSNGVYEQARSHRFDPPRFDDKTTQMRLKTFTCALLLLAGRIGLPQAFADKGTTLEEALTQAYRQSLSLEAERAKLRGTDEAVSEAVSHLRPTIQATTALGHTWQQEGGPSTFSGTTREHGLQVTQPIFPAFQTRYEIKVAEKKVMAERAVLQATEQKLFLDISTTFLDTLRDEKILSLKVKSKEVLRRKLDEVTARSQIGDLTRTDFYQAESRLARAEVDRLQIENSVHNDRTTYERLVGAAPVALTTPEIGPTTSRVPEELLRQAKAQNPEVLAAEFALEEATAEVSLNKGSLAPEVNLLGNTSYNIDQGGGLPPAVKDGQLLVEISIPLYDGANYSKIRGAMQISTQRRMELEDARERACALATNACESLQTAIAMIDAVNAEINASQKSLEGVSAEAQLGTRTTLDVLNAEQEVLEAKTELATAQHDEILAKLQIRAAIGELTAKSLRLPVTLYDPLRHYNEVRNKWFGFGNANKDVYVNPVSNRSTTKSK